MVLWQSKGMQNKGAMRFFLPLLLVMAFAGCERSTKDHGITDDVRAKNALKAAFVEARLAAYDHKDKLNSVSELIVLMEQQGHMSAMLTYGNSNVFLNPQISIWKAPTLSNQIEAAACAIVIRRSTNDYAYITFDGRFAHKSRRPVEWCE